MTSKKRSAQALQFLAPRLSAYTPWLAARVLKHLFMHPQRRQPSASQRQWLASAQADTIQVGGRKIATYSWGEAGPTVLLVHGWSGRGSQLGIFAAPLVERGFRVLTFDGPAHGDSEGYYTNLVDFAEATLQLQRQHGPMHGVIAHSFGCATVTFACAQGARFQRAVYLAPPEEMEAQLRRVAGWVGFSPDIVPRTRALVERKYDVDLDTLNGRALAPQLGAELLAFHDDTDVEVPIEEGEALVAAWPTAELVRSHGLGHHHIIRDPGVNARALDFLTAPVAARAAG